LQIENVNLLLTFGGAFLWQGSLSSFLLQAASVAPDIRSKMMKVDDGQDHSTVANDTLYHSC